MSETMQLNGSTDGFEPPVDIDNILADMPEQMAILETQADFFDRTEELDLPSRKRAARERVKALAEAGVSEETKQEERDFLKEHAKLSVGDFNSLYAASERKASKDKPASEPEEEGFSWIELFGLDEEVQTPSRYTIRPDGVWYLTDDGDYSKITFAPLVVTAVYADAQGDQSAELAWTNFDGRVVRRIVSKGILRRGRKLIEELAEAGLPVIESDSKMVERWLAEFESANHRSLKVRYIARCLGWQHDGSFVASPDGDVRVEVPYDDQKGPAKAHCKGGTFEGWKDGIAALEEHRVPRVVIASAFAATLIRPLDVASFTVDISSRSTRGKTTVLEGALSAWANPGDDAEAMATWRTTHISIEKRLNLVRGIVTVLDETMTVESEEIISSVLYDLPKGVGKARSGGWPSRLQWETVLISTGERPALSYSTHQGAAARVLSITKPPFGEGGGPAAVALREAVMENHGHAGPAFAEKLVELIAQDGKAGLRERHRELTEELRGATDMTGRRAPMVAAVALAEQLACEWDILPYDPMPVSAWQQMFTEIDDQTDNRPEMAMEVVRAYVASHSDHIYKQYNGVAMNQQPGGGWIGMIVPARGEEPTKIALTPDKVRKILQASNYSYDAVLEGWLDAGYLELSPSQRPAHLIPKRMGGGTRVKMLVFTPEAISVGASTDE